MMLLTPDLRFALRANDIARRAALRDGQPAPDPTPLLKLFHPVGAATWLATELAEDGDRGESRASPRLFGLADLGFGRPELGYISLLETASVRLPFGLRIERDISFETPFPLSVWAARSRAAGSIVQAEATLFRAANGDAHPRLPPSEPDAG